MLNTLLLLSGNDIPFIQAQISIHQPTIKEIGYIGEEEFHVGSRFLLFNKDNLDLADVVTELNTLDNAVTQNTNIINNIKDKVTIYTDTYNDGNIKIEYGEV